MGILSRELWSLYRAYTEGEPSELEEPPIQYADFAVWQRQWLQGDALDSQIAYWKKHLADLPTLSLPTDRSRAPRPSYRGARVPITFPASLSAAINALSNECGVTPFMTLLAGFHVLLYRYCGQEDIVVGVPIANRNGSELEPLIGFFANTLVLRCDLSGNPTFKALLARVRDVCLAAYEHQDLPFEKLVWELQPERDQSRNPLFQAMFVLQNATKPFQEIDGIRIDPVDIERTRSQFDLALFLRERDGKYIGYFEYSTDLFDKSTIERMAGHLSTLLEGIVRDSDHKIATLPILTDRERDQLLVEWNDTAADYPKNKCIHQLFEDQVKRTPDAIAIEFGDQQLSYRDLNQRANQLAHYLIGLGIGPEALVGICVERSLEMVVGLLGILKAGGAYVPLDAAYPNERLRFMLEDAHVSVLLTQQDLGADRGLIVENSDRRSSIFLAQIKVICLDREWPLIAQQSDKNPRSDVSSENLAYVIYTSGSTGQPKGVAIEHRNTVNFLHWANNVYQNRDLKGVLASTSICFDLSVFELFVPLCRGGKAILAENILCLADLRDINEVTLINTVPSAMSALLSGGDLPASVRTVNLAGEPLRSEIVEQIYERGTVEQVYDLYGPSETTTYSTFALRASEGPETIGRPIANTDIYILDARLRPVPVGVTGELFIGGAGVARGYLNRPDLTKERFVPNPFRPRPASRLYRTGDIGRYLPDGQIEFLCRTDNQVKIRGHRVELGDVEVALRQHPAVKETVVLGWDGKFENAGNQGCPKSKIGPPKCLIGYVVPTRRSASLITELRDYLSEKLPAYMIPSAFIFLDALPLTPNGKVDCNALPAPEEQTQPSQLFTEPRSHVEELVSQIWCDVLKIKNVGLRDNFFELGGHSLLAIQIVARLREAFGREISLNVLFDSPTVADLTTAIDKLLCDGNGPELPPIERIPRDGPLPLSANQEHLWRLDRMMPRTHFFNMPYVYRLSGDLDIAALERALQEIIRRHEALRTIFAEVNGDPIQLIKSQTDFLLSVIDLQSSSGGDPSEIAADIILQERTEPFDLEVGPLIRIKLLCLTETEHLFLLTIHHIVSDDVSMNVFRRELTILYESFSQHQPSPLRDVGIQFADYAVWERRLLDHGDLKPQMSYWKTHLAAPRSMLRFQMRREPEQTCNFQTSRHPIEINETLFSRIVALASQEHCTPAMVFLAGLSAMLHVVTQTTDIRIGILVPSRRSTGTEDVMGHLLNTLVLRTTVPYNATFEQVLRQMRYVMLAAFRHQELPFESLACAMENDEGAVRSSLFQVLVSYRLDAPLAQTGTGRIFAPVALRSITEEFSLTLSTFDLIFNVTQTSTKLTGGVNYKTDLFEAATVMHIEKVFALILQGAVENAREHIAKLALDGRLR